MIFREFRQAVGAQEVIQETGKRQLCVSSGRKVESET